MSSEVQSLSSVVGLLYFSELYCTSLMPAYRKIEAWPAQYTVTCTELGSDVMIVHVIIYVRPLVGFSGLYCVGLVPACRGFGAWPVIYCDMCT